MKILAIDDQQLVLLPLQKKLIELGFDVKIDTNGSNAARLYDEFKPDLVIIDINLPGLISGLDIVNYIRIARNSSTPIMILSGNTDDQVIAEAYAIGVNDYLKKPLSLNEVCVRVKRLIGESSPDTFIWNNDTIIQHRCVGVVIPCYNEESRLLSKEFIEFIDKNSGYHLCFVNDGSTDNTLAVLNALGEAREDYISVYNCKKNGGKAEAVRQGMLHLSKKEDLDYIGFLDADLSTDLKDFDDLVSTIEKSNFKIVSGSRITRMGANITKESARKLISMTINFIIRKILKMNFKDTQCGAKIFHKDVIKIAFDKKFVTKWIFDVEIFKRISAHFGIEEAKNYICEQPLKRWIHADGSKLSMKDSFKIVMQLAQIAWVYRGKNNLVA